MCRKALFLLSPCLCFTRVSNKNIKVNSFKSSENVQKKDGGPDRHVPNNKFSLMTLNDCRI